MPIDFVAASSFILVSIFTPGPNNVSSAAMGALHGYRKTLNYLVGMAVGFLIVILLCALVSASVLRLFPQIETVLRYLGAAYILYLAFAILKATYSVESENVRPMAFGNGIVLQFLNPKLIVYGLTLFSTFFAPLTEEPVLLVVVSLVLGLLSFVSVSLWALFGTMVTRYLRSPRARLIVNAVLSLFLVYTALDIVGIL